MTVPYVSQADRALFNAPSAPRANPHADPALAAFRDLLRSYRGARRWSQERCAAEAEMDHSLVSRLESGQRTPTRDAIGKLATGLELTPWQHDDLLMSAGYLPASVAPDDLRGAVALLRETTTAERDAARALIASARRL